MTPQENPTGDASNLQPTDQNEPRMDDSSELQPLEQSQCLSAFKVPALPVLKNAIHIKTFE